LWNSYVKNQTNKITTIVLFHLIMPITAKGDFCIGRTQNLSLSVHDFIILIKVILAVVKLLSCVNCFAMFDNNLNCAKYKCMNYNIVFLSGFFRFNSFQEMIEILFTLFD